MELFCDGASRGNPGPGAYGFVLLREGKLVDQKGARMGVCTNNVAEYTALIRGLERALELGTSAIVVKSDSQLLIRQLNGQYKVKTPHILELFKQAKALLVKFQETELIHIPREENSLADALCNEALDA